MAHQSSATKTSELFFRKTARRGQKEAPAINKALNALGRKTDVHPDQKTLKHHQYHQRAKSKLWLALLWLSQHS